MLLQKSSISALFILFSCSVAADDLFLHGIEANKSLMDSMSALHQKNSITRQQAFTGDDCPGATSRPFSGNGLTSGHSSTHCYVTEYDSGNVETYFQSSPDGSYSTGFSWTFE